MTPPRPWVVGEFIRSPRDDWGTSCCGTLPRPVTDRCKFPPDDAGNHIPVITETILTSTGSAFAHAFEAGTVTDHVASPCSLAAVHRTFDGNANVYPAGETPHCCRSRCLACSARTKPTQRFAARDIVEQLTSSKGGEDRTTRRNRCTRSPSSSTTRPSTHSWIVGALQPMQREADDAVGFGYPDRTTTQRQHPVQNPRNGPGAQPGEATVHLISTLSAGLRKAPQKPNDKPAILG